MLMNTMDCRRDSTLLHSGSLQQYQILRIRDNTCHQKVIGGGVAHFERPLHDRCKNKDLYNEIQEERPKLSLLESGL